MEPDVGLSGPHHSSSHPCFLYSRQPALSDIESRAQTPCPGHIKAQGLVSGERWAKDITKHFSKEIHWSKAEDKISGQKPVVSLFYPGSQGWSGQGDPCARRLSQDPGG